jgi:dihydrofolate reductase
VAKLIYSAIASLDGYVADEEGNFDWSAPDEEVHSFVNELERPIGTYLYGRRMYEVLAYWETADAIADLPPFAHEFAEIWQAELFVTPIVVGGGKPSLPKGVRVTLELLDERRFGNGVVYLHYRLLGA